MMKTLTDNCMSKKDHLQLEEKEQVECPDQSHFVLMKEKRCHAKGKNLPQ